MKPHLLRCIAFSVTMGLLGCADKAAPRVAPDASAFAPAARAESLAGSNSRLAYPDAKRGDVIDDYHGVEVPDPYRWLEEVDSPDTNAFIESQNKLVRGYVDGDTRERVRQRLTELMDYPRYGAPRKEGDRYIYTKNAGLQNQSVLYIADKLDAEPRVLIDPNTWSKDGTVAISGTTYTQDGKLLVYGKSVGGSDQKDLHVRDVDGGKDLPDVLRHCKFSSVAWKPDKIGFWYNRYPAPGSVPRDDQAKYNKLYYHQLGTPQEQDRLLFAPEDKELSASPYISDSGEYLLMYQSRGSTPRNRLYYRRADESGADSDGNFKPLFDKEDASYSFIDHDGPTFFIRTNLDAPRGRVIAVNIHHPEKENWKTIVPESKDALVSVNLIDDQFVVGYLKDAYSAVKIFDKAGKFVRDVELPGIGSVSGFNGKRTDTETFFTFTSYTHPPTIYRYDMTAHKAEVFRKPEVKFDPLGYETKQVFVTSKDGTKAPMFITHKKGLKLDGNNPTILSAYGGFNVSQRPGFSTSKIVWLENGGVLCTGILRGGGEYGEEWHQAGMLERKQNVFDDFYACAQWLIDNKYTNPKRLAVQGGSNGGLLVAATVTQRPDLIGAALCHVPLTDMLRYHKFSVGRFWIPEYGSAESSMDQFEFLRAYSPLHQVRRGESYPPTMVFTAEGDDRVVPHHARKFVAELQHADAGTNPILLRTETKAGHGGGKPVTKQIDQSADEYAFLWRVFKMGWK